MALSACLHKSEPCYQPGVSAVKGHNTGVEEAVTIRERGGKGERGEGGMVTLKYEKKN